VRESGASRAIDMIGDAWVLRILRSAFRGTRRFSGFVQALEVSRAVLSERLERMVADGLLVKIAPDGGHAEYRLTEPALDLWGTLIAMWRWERDWGTGRELPATPADRPRSRLLHRDCGHEMTPRCVCSHCREEITPFETEAVLQACAEAPTPADGSERARKRYRKSNSADRGTLPTLMRVYGDRWNAALMAAALQGARTFSEFERALGIGPTQLSDRLAELQALGLVRARAYAGSRHEYRLTRVAIATFPITLELIAWGDRWLWGGLGPLAVRHRRCGQPADARWACGHCAGLLERKTVVFAD
jgi:DNA-binding HxlR family transcriptional regulator